MSEGWHVGFARRDLTAWEPGQAMLGWGVFTHRVREVGERLHVRAVVLRSADRRERVALASLDLGILPQRLREAVVDRLVAHHAASGLDGANVMLVATHTHAAPDGLTDDLLYGASNLGFAPGVFAHVVDAVVAALVAAEAAARPACVQLGRASVPRSVPVMFQRSLDAFRANNDVREVDDARDALDREVSVLRVSDPSGGERGVVVFLASHGTLVHADVPRLHPDHPGLTAGLLEAAGGADHVALVVQTGAGDVSPNHRWDPVRRLRVGAEQADEDSARAAALHLAAAAQAAVRDAARAEPLSGALRSALRYVDFREAPVAAAFGEGRARRTRQPCLGLSFTLGTAEGPGPLRPVAGPIRRWQAARARLGREDPQLRWGDLELGLRGGLLGGTSLHHVAWARRFDPVLAWLTACDRAGLLAGRAWVPTRLPAQVLTLGPLVIGGVAGEPTTVAARRLRAALRASTGARHAIAVGYANAYAGYVTTAEEYRVQAYEGGHTLFGPWTCGAWLTALAETAAASGVAGPRPEIVDELHLRRERDVGRAGLGRFAHWVAGQDPDHVRT